MSRHIEGNNAGNNAGNTQNDLRVLWLSHALNSKTPTYGGSTGLSVSQDKSIKKGDSCNTNWLRLNSHIGSHVDAPLHFINDGACVDDYPAQEWVFSCPLLLDVATEASQLLSVKDFADLVSPNVSVDLLLIRTGFEAYRDQSAYWQSGPGLSPELAAFLREAFPSIQAVGLDTISISSYQHREAGREAHLAFLSQNIRILRIWHLQKFVPLKA